MSWFELNGDELRWVSCVESVDLRAELCELRSADMSWMELSCDEWVVLSQLSWVEMRWGKVRWVECSWFELNGTVLRWSSCVESVELRAELCELRSADLNSMWFCEVIGVEWSWVEMSVLCSVSCAELRSNEVRWVGLSWFELFEFRWADLN